MLPEPHSEFLPDDLFHGLGDALSYPKRQKLDFTVGRPEIMNGSGSLQIVFLGFPKSSTENSSLVTKPIKSVLRKCPREDMP